MTLHRRTGDACAEPSPASVDRGTGPALQRSAGGRVTFHGVCRGLPGLRSSCLGCRRPGGCTRDVATRWQRYTTERYTTEGIDIWPTKAEGFFWCTSISTPSTTRNSTSGITP